MSDPVPDRAGGHDQQPETHDGSSPSQVPVDELDGLLRRWARGRWTAYELVEELPTLSGHPVAVRVSQAHHLIELFGTHDPSTRLAITVRLGVPLLSAVHDSAGNVFGNVAEVVAHLVDGAVPAEAYELVEQAAGWLVETDITAAVVGLAACPSSRDRTRGWPSESRRPHLHWYSWSVRLDGWRSDDGTSLSPVWPTPACHPPREALRQPCWPDAAAALAMLGFEIGYPAPAGPWEDGLLVVAIDGNDPQVVLLGPHADRASVRISWSEIDRPTGSHGAPRFEVIPDERTPAERIGESLFGTLRDPLPANGIGLWDPHRSGWVVVTGVDREGRGISFRSVGAETGLNFSSWEAFFADPDRRP